MRSVVIRYVVLESSSKSTNQSVYNCHKCRLEIKQVGEGGHHVPGLVEARVKNVSEVWEVLRTGSNGRAVGSTNANEHSSRSHWFVFFCTLFQCILCHCQHGKSMLKMRYLLDTACIVSW